MKNSSISALVFLFLVYTAGTPFVENIVRAEPTKTVPQLSQASAEQAIHLAQEQYSGDGLLIRASADGATLRCAFQKLEGQATTNGLWLTSTARETKSDSFRIVAVALGREHHVALPTDGKVEVDGKVARFVRPALTEEYSVGMDGVEQDFVIDERPQGDGILGLELKADGGRFESRADGAELILDKSGRRLAYNRLKALDARGRELKTGMKVISSGKLLVWLEDAKAVYPVRIDPTFSDANWISFGGTAGTDAPVSAAVVDGQGNVYIGGGFTVIFNTVAPGVAKWDGTSWSALGSGIQGSVFALTVSGTNLYAGGSFTNAGGVAVKNIAHWDGNSWSAMGSGMNQSVLLQSPPPPVSALLAVGSTVYVGGTFTNAGTVAATNIAMWDGNSWSALGSGLKSPVAALAIFQNVLYAGIAGGNNQTNIAAWNGTSWSPVGSGVDYRVYALASSSNYLYVGGNFTTAGGLPATNIARWDGSTWSTLGSVLNYQVNALAFSGGILYVGGDFTSAGGISANYIAQWDGTNWSTLGGGFSSSVSALAVSGSNVFAGGHFARAESQNAHYVARWDGTSWSAMGTGIDGSILTVAVAQHNLYVGGQFSQINGIAITNIARWDGTSWSALGSGVGPGPSLVERLVSDGTNIYAGGAFLQAGGITVNNVAKWDGSSWSALGLGLPSGGPYAMAVSGSNLYVGGGYLSQAGGVAVNNIAKWNGSSWSALGSGVFGGAVDSLAASGDIVYAGGRFTNAGGIAANEIAKWDGNSWSALGTGTGFFGSDVYALLLWGTNLYAGGGFASMGGAPNTEGIAQWNGTSWSSVGSGVGGAVYALAVVGTNLYAGGFLQSAGGVPVNNIARWDGTSWSALGSGTGPGINSLAGSGPNLFATGSLSIAGTNVSTYLTEVLLDGPPAILNNDGNFGFTNSNTTFGFNVAGSAGECLVIQGSTDLAHWTSLQTNTLTNSQWYFSDSGVSGFTNRYYRVRLLP